MAYFAPYIDASGLHMPTYEDRLAELVQSYKLIFGIDSELSESVPDYQLLSVFAKALDDTSMLVLQAYASRNPFLATGDNLDALLPLYGIVREAGEDDATVRAKISTSLSARGAGTIDAIYAAVRNAKWVRDARVYENDTDSTDGNGIPAHTIATVIYAGDGPSVARAIWEHKAPGIGTYGNTSDVFTDDQGFEHRIYFTRSITRRVYVYMTVRRLPGCVEADVSAAITAAVNDYINSQLGVAEALQIPVLYAVGYNANPELSQTFAIADIFANIQGESTYTRESISCPWNGKISILASGGLTITFRD